MVVGGWEFFNAVWGGSEQIDVDGCQVWGENL